MQTQSSKIAVGLGSLMLAMLTGCPSTGTDYSTHSYTPPQDEFYTAVLSADGEDYTPTSEPLTSGQTAVFVAKISMPVGTMIGTRLTAPGGFVVAEAEPSDQPYANTTWTSKYEVDYLLSKGGGGAWRFDWLSGSQILGSAYAVVEGSVATEAPIQFE